jgi:cytosine/adenosine deaminase-related metal-dependent hydrolase
MAANIRTSSVETLKSVRIHDEDPSSLWDISFARNNGETTISPSKSIAIDKKEEGDSSAPLVLPALVHPHIHLDKAFIHGSKEYSDLLPVNGSFEEALHFTTLAKKRFHYDDLMKRGNQLVTESVAAGVTAIRGFVEVDSTVKMACLEVGKQLKKEWKDICQIQLVSFAQDPIFAGQHAEKNRRRMEHAVRDSEVDVIGTTPYVELTVEASRENIEWAISRAWELQKHVDFHIDYNINENSEAMVWYVLETLKKTGWTASATKARVMLGHCTRLTLFSDDEWGRLASTIHDHDLPVSFVALPTSDLYMASLPVGENVKRPHVRPRGTLQVLHMIQDLGLDAVIGVNNVGNAFTPWGSVDPISLACLGVGIYHGRKTSDVAMLYECISTRARVAIGLAESSVDIGLKKGYQRDLLILPNVDQTGFGQTRPKQTVADVVWEPPEVSTREVISNGRLLLKNTAMNRLASIAVESIQDS